MNIINSDFRVELLREDTIPRKLNHVSLKYRDLLLKELSEGKIKTEIVTQCPCGSERLEQLTKIDRFGLPFGSLICQDCGLVITNPQIQQDSLPYYYDKFYHPLNYGKEQLGNQTALFQNGQGKKIYGIVKDFLPHQEIIDVLEIGAGTGNVLFEFKEEALKDNIQINELGTEYSNDCIRKCREQNINIVEGNIETILGVGKKFDLIILSHVFEHFIDLQKELNDLKKLMTDQSLLYIEVPGILKNHNKKYYDFSFLGYVVHAHMYNFTFATLTNILAKNEFSLVFGNENVESVFIKKSEKYFMQNDYARILNYLEFLKDNEKYASQQKLIIDEQAKKIDEQAKKIDEQAKKIDEQQNKLLEIKKFLSQKEQKLQEIYHSRGYKILSKYYKIKIKLKTLLGKNI